MVKQAKRVKMPKYPSYEDGRLRDPEIAKKQDSDFQAEDLRKLVKKAVKRVGPASGA